jgi:hypothetical protein
MPIVKAPPRSLQNGSTVTQFTNTTNTISTTYTYPTTQTNLIVENSGEHDVYLTVGNVTDQLIKVDTKYQYDGQFTEFSIHSDIDSQEFIATAIYQEYTDFNSLNDQLNSLETSLAQKAAQADLDTTKANVALKANQSDLVVTNTNVSSTNSRIDTLVINSGNANAEVSDAHVSTAKNKTYTTLRNRLEAVETDNIPIYRVAQTVGMGVKNYQSNATVTDNGNGTFALVKTVTGSDGFEITINYNRDIDLSFSFDGDTSTMGTVTMQRYNGGTFLNNLYAGATITKGSKTLTAQDIVT